MNRLLVFLLLALLPLPLFVADGRPLVSSELVPARDPSGFTVIRHGDGYLLIRVTEGSDWRERLDVQRISGDGRLVDLEPIHLAATSSQMRWIVATRNRTFVMMSEPAGVRVLAFDEELQPLFERHFPGLYPRVVAATENRLLVIRTQENVTRAEVWDEDAVRVGGSVLFETLHNVAVDAVAAGEGFVVAASSRAWGEMRAVRIEASGKAGDIRIIDNQAFDRHRVVANEAAVLVLSHWDSGGELRGRILDHNGEPRSAPFSVFSDDVPYVFAAAGVEGGFLVASEPGIRIGWIPSDGESVVSTGVLGRPGTFPAAASSGRGDALFVYRSARVMTGKLIGPELANSNVEVEGLELPEQAAVAGATAGDTGLAGLVEWNGTGVDARATRIVEGTALDDPPLMLGPSVLPLRTASVDVAASESEFVVTYLGARRITGEGDLGAPLQVGPKVASDGKNFFFFHSSSTAGSWRIRGSLLPGGTDLVSERTEIATAERPVERLQVSSSGNRYLLTWDDFVPCMILCPPQRGVVRGAIVDEFGGLVVAPFEMLEGVFPVTAGDGERFLVGAWQQNWGLSLALVDRAGRRLDGRGVSDSISIPISGRPLEAWWDGARFTVATEEALYEIDDDLQLTSVRAVPTTLHKSSSVGFIAPDLLLYMSAAGAGQPSGGIPRAYITELRREATVDLSVRIERTVRRGETRHHLVVKNDSATPATGVVLGSAFGPHPVGVGCSTSAGSESRCRRESLGAGAEWRMELVPGWVTSPDLPIHVWVAARELDLDPADNQNPPIVDVPAGRSRAVVRP